MSKIRVLIVDDSALMRDLLSLLLRSDSEIEVVGVATDPYDAREKIKELNPDVVTLDVEMPRMDGVTFLRNLMRLRPMPVVMVSSLVHEGADLTLEALSIGAVDFITKPKFDMEHGIEESAKEIVEKVKAAAMAKVKRYDPQANADLTTRNQLVKSTTNSKVFSTTDKVIAIGASTGGVEAIREVITALPPDAPGVVIVQHMPGGYTSSFAERLNDQAAMEICEAVDGQQILRGHVYIAPGARHIQVMRSGARYHCKLSDGPLVNHFKPSVDVLFDSVAKNVGKNAVAALLTGMGFDGAEGMRALRRSGAYTIAQDEASSVVWGMPAKAIERQGADIVLPLDKIASELLKAIAGNVTKKTLKKRPRRPLYNSGSL